MSPGSWPCLLLLLFLLLSSQRSLPGSALGRLGRCVAFLTRTRIDGVATGQGGLRRFAQRHWQGCSVRERPEGSHGTGSCPSSTHKSKILKLGPKTTCHSFRLANCLLFVDSSLPPSSPPSSPPYPPFTTLTRSPSTNVPLPTGLYFAWRWHGHASARRRREGGDVRCDMG